MSDKIIIRGLELRSRIGVTAAERRSPQRLSITIEISHPLSLAGQSDDLKKTIDYDAVARRVTALAAKGTRSLIERLAEEIAGLVRKEFHAKTVTVTVKKFVVPKTRSVEVKIKRSGV